MINCDVLMKLLKKYNHKSFCSLLIHFVENSQFIDDHEYVLQKNENEDEFNMIFVIRKLLFILQSKKKENSWMISH